jgi:hypothetical protein
MGGNGVMSKKFFIYEAIPDSVGKYTITPVFKNLPITRTTGSFNLLPARLCNLSYAQYLRFARDILGAEIIGKGRLYPIAIFKQTKEFFQFMRLLNETAKYLLHIKNFPDLLEKAEEVGIEVE